MVIIECELEKRAVFVRENPVMGITKLFLALSPTKWFTAGEDICPSGVWQHLETF